jgi:hypothetical protein
MHRGHDHDHDHWTGDGRAPGLGHNHAHLPKQAVQWQTPHLAHEHPHEDRTHGEPDLDLVEAAFVEAFTVASDPTSFLRLAHVPFETLSADSAKLTLLRVEADVVTDVGTLTPHLGGQSFRYDPLPAGLVGRRRRLRFIYFDGRGLRELSLAEIRELS